MDGLKNREFTNPNLETSTITNIPVVDAANKIRGLIYKDELTGCYNKNFFENFKKENFNIASGHNNIALVFVDLNNLKTINDNFGHEAGDRLIKRNADFLKNNFSENDFLIRLGGDDIIII